MVGMNRAAGRRGRCTPVALVSAISIAQGEGQTVIVWCILARLGTHVGYHGNGGGPEGGSLRSVGIDISVGAYHFT